MSSALVTSKKRGAKDAASDSIRTYRAALSDPFSSLAQGARVPDMYSVPTTTRHITRRCTIVSNASGEFDLVVLPSAYFHAISPRGNIVGGGNWATLDGLTVNNAVLYTSEIGLAAQLTNYRIVGYGVQLVGTASLTNTQGMIAIATLPAEGFLNSKGAVGGQASNFANAAASVANTLTAYGVPNSSSTVAINSMLSLPNSVETSMVSISEHPITVTPKICSPSAFNFRLTTDMGPGFNITSQTSAVSVSAGNASWLSFGGHESIVIAGSGLPNSTNVLEFEIIYHLEGTPYITSTANYQIGSDAATTVVNPVAWMEVVRDVASMPTFRTVAVGAGNALIPGLGTLLNKLF